MTFNQISEYFDSTDKIRLQFYQVTVEKDIDKKLSQYQVYGILSGTTSYVKSPQIT